MNERGNSLLPALKNHFKNPSFLLLVLIIFTAFTVRIYQLDAEDLELAEGFRLAEADTLDAAFYKPLNFEEHPPLYLIFLYFWRSFGEDVFFLRFSSVLFGVGAIIFLYLIGKELFGKKVGLIAALIMSLNPLHINYSQNLEPYALTTFLSFMSFYFLIKALEYNKPKYYFLFILSIVLTGYSDYFTAFLLLAVVLFFILYHKTYRNRIKNLILSGLCSSLLFVPLIFMGLFTFLSLLGSEKFAGLKHPLWYILILPYNLVTFIVGENSLFFDSSHLPQGIWLPGLLLIVSLFGIFFLKGVLLWKENKEKTTRLLSIFLLPPLLLYLTSFFTFMYIDPHRFLFISFPFFILMAKGLASLKEKKVFIIFLVVFLIIGSVLVYSNLQQRKTKIAEISSFIELHYQPEDVVAVLPQEYLPVLWYYLPDNFSVTSFPQHFPLDTYTKFKRADFSLQTIDEDSIPVFLKYQEELSRGYSRLWYLVDLNRASLGEDKHNFVLNYLSQSYPLILSRKSPDERIGLYLFLI